MKLLNPIAVTLAMLFSTACGSTTNSSDTPFIPFDLNNYQIVSDSGNLNGMWVGVGNHSGSGSEDGMDYSFKASQKRVFSIFSADQETLYVSDCNGKSIVINQDDDQIEIEGNLVTSIVNNNTIILQDQEEGFSWTAIKINHSPDTLGTVLTSGSGDLLEERSQLALSLCQQKLETQMITGHSFTILTTQVSLADNLDVSIDDQHISEMEYSRSDLKGPSIEEAFDETLEYQSVLDGGYTSVYFYQGDGQGDSIELALAEDSSYAYVAQFNARSDDGEESAAIKLNLAY